MQIALTLQGCAVIVLFGGPLLPTFLGDKKLLIYFLNITLVLDSLDTVQTCSVLIFLNVLQPCKSLVVTDCTTLLIQLFISI